MTMSQLDSAQVIKSVYDSVNEALQVNVVASTGLPPGYAEDSPHVSGDIGSLPLAVRNDAGTALAADGNYIPLTTDANGALRVAATVNEVATAADGAALPALVKVIGGYDGAAVQAIHTDASGDLQIDVLTSALPAGASTSANQVTELASLASIDTKLTDGSQQTLLTDGTDIALITVTGELHVLATPQAGTDIGDVTINNAAGAAAVNIQDGGNSLTVDATDLDIRDLTSVSDSVSAVQSGTWDINDISGTISLPTGASTLAEQQSQTTSLQLLDDAVATTGAAITAKGFAASGTDGTNARILKTDASGELQVDVLTLPAITATDLDIRDLTSASDSVAAVQSGVWNITNVSGTVSLPTGASTSANQINKAQYTRLTDGTDDALVTAAGELNVLATAQPGVDVGDVTINNAAGAAAVNIQDGGNSLTVDGTVAATQSGAWNITNITGTVSLPTGAATEATIAARLSGSLVPTAFDEVDLTYVAAGNGTGQIATAVYKLATVTVKTLTLSYDASNRVSSVVAS